MYAVYDQVDNEEVLYHGGEIPSFGIVADSMFREYLDGQHDNNASNADKFTDKVNCIVPQYLRTCSLSIPLRQIVVRLVIAILWLLFNKVKS